MRKMELEKSNQIVSKDYDYEPAKVMEEKMKEELKLEKPHQNALYKILKYNPIDPLNDLYRDIIERLNLTELEKKLQWRAANIWVKLALRTFWNFKAEYPKKNIKRGIVTASITNIIIMAVRNFAKKRVTPPQPVRSNPSLPLWS